LEKERGKHFRMPDDAQVRRAAARDPSGRLQLQLVLLGGRFQAVGLLVDHVAEAFGELGELLRAFLLRDLGGDFLARFFQRLCLSGLDRGQLIDVQSELAFDRPGDLALLHREHCVLERLDHHPATEEAEIASLFRPTPCPENAFSLARRSAPATCGPRQGSRPPFASHPDPPESGCG
jgi:hypothetical protein